MPHTQKVYLRIVLYTSIGVYLLLIGFDYIAIITH